MPGFFFPCSRPSWAPSPSATWSRARWAPKGWWVLTFHLSNTWRVNVPSSPERFSHQDKILLSGGKGGTVTVTNDGATILKAIGVDNPAAKVLVGE